MPPSCALYFDPRALHTCLVLYETDEELYDMLSRLDGRVMDNQVGD